ncbi:type II secretion system protein G precursor [bacterium BMS3Abin15]|nr:type II secretion system protein G precursor [bacterium BMS3Abin15]HDZ85210.1 prepilin-type N-terminal cleavage/methylation domain-containing protein [Candidatus Moranbacteria bacterium]
MLKTKKLCKSAGWQTRGRQKGFTLLEILITILIIGIVTTAIIVYIAGSVKKNTRDKQRMQELNQIAKLLDIYYIDNGCYPTEASGGNGIVGEGAGIDSVLFPGYTSTSLPHDPLGPGDATYRYYYDGRHICGTWKAAIYAIKMEDSSNAESAGCTGGEGREGFSPDEGYTIILGDSCG